MTQTTLNVVVGPIGPYVTIADLINMIAYAFSRAPECDYRELLSLLLAAFERAGVDVEALECALGEME